MAITLIRNYRVVLFSQLRSHILTTLEWAGFYTPANGRDMQHAEYRHSTEAHHGSWSPSSTASQLYGKWLVCSLVSSFVKWGLKVIVADNHSTLTMLWSTVLKSLNVLTHWILTHTLLGRHYYNPILQVKKLKQREGKSVTFPELHIYAATLGFTSRQAELTCSPARCIASHKIYPSWLF